MVAEWRSVQDLQAIKSTVILRHPVVPNLHTLLYWSLYLLKANFSPWFSSLASQWITPDTMSLLLLGKDNTPGQYSPKVLLKVSVLLTNLEN